MGLWEEGEGGTSHTRPLLISSEKLKEKKRVRMPLRLVNVVAISSWYLMNNFLHLDQSAACTFAPGKH